MYIKAKIGKVITQEVPEVPKYWRAFFATLFSYIVWPSTMKFGTTRGMCLTRFWWTLVHLSGSINDSKADISPIPCRSVTKFGSTEVNTHSPKFGELCPTFPGSKNIRCLALMNATTGNCAVHHGGSFWYNNCYGSSKQWLLLHLTRSCWTLGTWQQNEFPPPLKLRPYGGIKMNV